MTRMLALRFEPVERIGMEPQTPFALLLAAAGIGVFHTVTGPDHYVPFIALSRARRWSPARTLWVTTVCGIGHVLGSVVIGTIGIALGWAAGLLEWIESTRGAVAGWLLLGFGLAYLVWGLRRAHRSRPHEHVHLHEDGTVHTHPHTHLGEHTHVHDTADQRPATAWILFLIFVFGPCEPLIPLLMLPAAGFALIWVAAVAVVFSIFTIATMLAAVGLGIMGVRFVALHRFARYGHALAGLAVALCGAAVQFGF